MRGLLRIHLGSIKYLILTLYIFNPCAIKKGEYSMSVRLCHKRLFNRGYFFSSPQISRSILSDSSGKFFASKTGVSVVLRCVK